VFSIKGLGYRDFGLGFTVYGLGFGVLSSGLRVLDSWHTVSVRVLEAKVYGLRIMVKGLGFRA
jgi:hypothetical protein